MAIASTMSDTIPTPWDGKNLWNGKRNPVTLVSTVVTRNSAVQPSSRFPPSSPSTTTNPDKIPSKLNITCTKVNGVIPKIMMLPSLRKGFDDPAERKDTVYRTPVQFSQVFFPRRFGPGSSLSRSPHSSRSFPSPLPHSRGYSNTDALRDPAPLPPLTY